MKIFLNFSESHKSEAKHDQRRGHFWWLQSQHAAPNRHARGKIRHLFVDFLDFHHHLLNLLHHKIANVSANCRDGESNLEGIEWGCDAAVKEKFCWKIGKKKVLRELRACLGKEAPFEFYLFEFLISKIKLLKNVLKKKFNSTFDCRLKSHRVLSLNIFHFQAQRAGRTSKGLRSQFANFSAFLRAHFEFL